MALFDRAHGINASTPGVRAVKLVPFPISKLRFLPYNPNRLPAGRLSALDESHREFGNLQPIVVNERVGKAWPAAERGLYVVAGEHRVRSARALKWASYEGVKVRLSPEKEKLANLALNLRGDFDLTAVAKMLKEIRAAEMKLLATGFEEQADALIAKLEKELAGPKDFPSVDRIDAPHRCPKCGYEWKGSCRP